MTEGLLVADEVAAFFFFALDDDFNDVADGKLGGAGVVEDLVERNETLGLEADVDDGVLVGDLDDGAGDDGLFGGQGLGGVLVGGLFAVKVFEGLGEVFGVVLGLGVFYRGRSVGLNNSCDGRDGVRGGVLRGCTKGLGCRRCGCFRDRGLVVEGKVLRLREFGGRVGAGGFKCRVQGCALRLKRIVVVVGHIGEALLNPVIHGRGDRR